MKIGYDNGVTVSIDCIAVEKRIPRNMYECSEPDCRICNDPPEYVKLVRSEAVDHNLHKYRGGTNDFYIGGSNSRKGIKLANRKKEAIIS